MTEGRAKEFDAKPEAPQIRSPQSALPIPTIVLRGFFSSQWWYLFVSGSWFARRSRDG